MTQPDDPKLLLHALVDGELDPVNALAMERLLAGDPALSAGRDAIVALREAIRRLVPRERAPPELRARIGKAIGMRRTAPSPSWRALAASVALTAVVASGATGYLLELRRPARGPGTTRVENALVAGHIRALMAPQPSDVVSSDRHTVKPWFNGRVPESPRVVDLAGAGFPLIGGRLDVVNREPVPTLVYRHRKHIISLTEMPRPGAANAPQAASSDYGYNVVRWAANGVVYWAISDVAPADLAVFAKLFQATPPDQ